MTSEDNEKSALLSRDTPRLLYCPGDREALSDLFCLVRSQVEAFVATADDVKSRRKARGGTKFQVRAGNVGIRCIHCAACRAAPRDGENDGNQNVRDDGAMPNLRGAVSFPESVRLVYQSVRNFQRNHLLTCPAMPVDVKTKYLELKSSKLQGKRTVDRAEYWAECCRRMGMVDTDNGICLRGENFATDDRICLKHSDRGSSLMHGNRNRGTSANGKFTNDDEQVFAFIGDPETNNAVISDKCNRDLISCGDTKENTAESGIAARGYISSQMAPPLLSTDELFFNTEAAGMANIVIDNKNDHGDQMDLFLPDSPSSTRKRNLREDDSFCISIRALETQQEQSAAINKYNITNLAEEWVFNVPYVSSAYDGTCSSPDNSFASSTANRILSKDAVLDRVKLAHSVIHAIKDLQQVPLSDTCSSTEEFRLLGKELYELLSGLEWGEGKPSTGEGHVDNQTTNIDDSVFSDDLSQVRQRKRRGKIPEGSTQSKIEPLSEMGYPTSICSLISSLLDEEHSDDGDGLYSSINEVEEDLLLLTTSPDRYLFIDTNRQTDLTHIHFDSGTLYGREEQTSSLVAAYERMLAYAGTSSGKSEVVLLSGYSGTGKSSIVHNVQRRLIKRGACFVSGKFDAMQKMQPFSAIANALNEYCDLLAQDNDRIEDVREAVSAAVGRNIRAIYALIPNLSKIFPFRDDRMCSSCEFVPDAHHRLACLVRTIFRVSCSKANPLVLFLDDLQWSDEASLELVHALVTDAQLDALMFVGCYRDNEVGSDHPLLQHLNEIQNSETTNITSLNVNNLDKNSVNNLVSDALRMLPRQTRSLAEVVQEKTGGNALFAVQLLSSLYDDGHLCFSLVMSRWEWDLESIRARNIADNVAEFMKSKLLRLAPEVVNALKVVSAFGAQCHADLIRILDKCTMWLCNMSAALDIGVAEGLMAKVGGSVYRFSHDQIQSAAYQLIDESDREALHLKIGRSLLRCSSREEQDNYVFVIVDQLHRGTGLITDQNEKSELASLSLLAGRKAALMTAFQPALAFLRAGIDVVSEGDWEDQRECCFDLYNFCAEMECALGGYEDMNVHLELVLGRARTLEEKLQAYSVLVQSQAAQFMMDEAIDTAIMVLAKLGVVFPPDLSEAKVKQEIIMTQVLLGAKSGEQDLLQMQAMQDFSKRQAMKFLKLMACYTYTKRREYFCYGACKMVELTLSHGLCKESAYGFAVFGASLCGLLEDYSSGYHIGKLATTMVNGGSSAGAVEDETSDVYVRVYCTVFGWINNWVHPIQSDIPFLKEAFDVAISNGNTEFAWICATSCHMMSLASGRVLGPLADEMKGYLEKVKELNPIILTKHFHTKAMWQTHFNLLGRSNDPTKLVGEEMNEDSLLKNAEDGDQQSMKAGYIETQILFYRMWLEYLFGEYERAVETAQQNRDVGKKHMGRFVVICNYSFYSGLAAIALSRKSCGGKWTEMICKTMRQMEGWCTLSEWNCQHKLELMRAEYSYLLGNMAGAAKHYELAVEFASRHHFIHEEALALERAGIFYIETGDHETASALFAKAFDRYNKWGACSKAAHVRECYL